MYATPSFLSSHTHTAKCIKERPYRTHSWVSLVAASVVLWSSWNGKDEHDSCTGKGTIWARVSTLTSFSLYPLLFPLRQSRPTNTKHNSKTLPLTINLPLNAALNYSRLACWNSTRLMNVALISCGKKSKTLRGRQCQDLLGTFFCSRDSCPKDPRSNCFFSLSSLLP